ncbi:MAG: transcriptional repressor LexA [Clostridia bacterium]|nr:transcriptional repressor LexA [Clostridia bacterium]
MSKNFDEKQQELIKFIYDFTREHGYTPSVREMCNHMKFASTSTIFYYLQKCEDQGIIRRSKGKNRAIELVNAQELSGVPLVGRVAAGEPILAEQNIEDYFELPTNLFDYNNEELFMLNVKGESMIKIGINNGDKIIVKKQNTANNGQIVVALVDDSATVKRFYKENGYYRLQPENDTMEPIIVGEVSILGIVVGLIRKY